MPTAVTTDTPPTGIEYKAASGVLLASDDALGIVEALVSVTGIVDEQGDLIEPGAYADTLARRKSKGVRHHDWSRMAAKTLVQEELLPGDPRLPAALPNGDPWPAGAGALYIKGQYNLETRDGREGYSDAKFYADEGQWSIGYQPVKGTAYRRKDGVRVLPMVHFYEWSDVLHGAAPQTSTLAVKSAGPATETQVPVVETKIRDVLPGSYEERRDQLRDAVRATLGGVRTDNGPEWWVHIVGTWDDQIVATREGPNAEIQTWQIPYTIGETGAVTFGEMTRVQLVAQIVPATKTAQVSPATVTTVTGLLEEATAILSMAFAADTVGVKGARVAADDADRLAEATQRLVDVLDTAGMQMTDATPAAENPASGDETTTEEPSSPPENANDQVQQQEEPAALVLDVTELKAVLAGLHDA